MVVRESAKQRRAAETRRLRVVVIVAHALAALIGAGLLGWGLAQGVAEGSILIAAGGVGLLLTLLSVSVSLLLLAVRRDGTVIVRKIGVLRRLVERMNEHEALSDDARRVLHRRRERELLCGAIEEDIAGGEWDAAMVLTSELADRFGYRAEAEGFRQRIDQARFQVVGQQVDEAISLLDGLIIQRRWETAQSEAARIQRLFPDVPRVAGLGRRVEQAREAYKSDLERRFLERAHADDADGAMELLKELDAYLTEQEAEPYREVARGVIGRARDNLGARFKLAVHDHRWDVASQVGQQIIEEFPNTKMAQEVRHLLDGIRERAATMSGSAPA